MAALSDLFRHNLWANLALLDACASLSEEQLDASVPGTFGTTRATLMHLAGAERRYVQALRRQPRTPIPDEFPGFEELRASLVETGEALLTLCEELDGDDSFEREYDGVPWRIEHRVVLVQAINHATEHRTHIMTTVTAHGAPALDLDGWAWGEATGAMRSEQP